MVEPGGSGDIIFRSIQPGMEKRLGQSIVIDFRTGAGGLIGVREVVRSAGDGYTLLFGPTNNFVIDQYLYRKLDYDPLVDLVPVTVVAETPYLLVISEATPASNYGEFAAWARANRGKLNFGGSLGTPPQLLGSMFNKVADLGMTYVPYKGGAPSIPDLLAGRLQMQFDALTLLQPLIKEGKLRALAVASDKRWCHRSPRTPPAGTARARARSPSAARRDPR